MTGPAASFMAARHRPGGMVVFGITGRKNGGKTGLTERLIAHFTAQGLRVSAVKRAHHAAEVDYPGTDSYRLREAGAAQVVLSSPARVAVMSELRGAGAPGLDALLARLEPCDLVLVEGFKDAPHPKIEAWRPPCGQPPLAPSHGIVALAATARPETPVDLPYLDLDDTAAIADFITRHAGMRGRKRRSSMPAGVDWLPVAEAQARLRAALEPLGGSETLPPGEALGRVLAEPALARRSNPPRPNSAVDGFAVALRSLPEGPVPLVDGRAAAGQPFAAAVPPGHALRILTGAILPEGVDTVILQEDTRVEHGHAVFSRRPRPGANTREAGEDVAAGTTALPAGHRLRAPDLALLCALGVPSVAVRPRLRIGVLSTGDEIVPAPDLPAAPHQIWDANRPMLLALARGWGALPVDLGHAPDDPDAIRSALRSAAPACDLILTSGGASAGDEDHVAALLSAEARLAAWRIAMKPGRPLALAFWPRPDGGSVPVIGLPGNPVAALVCALIFAHPAQSLLAGAGWHEPRPMLLPAAFSKSKSAGRREYLRARLDDDGRVAVFASEGSGRISGLAWADGLVELADDEDEIRPGDLVRFFPYAAFGAT